MSQGEIMNSLLAASMVVERDFIPVKDSVLIIINLKVRYFGSFSVPQIVDGLRIT